MKINDGERILVSACLVGVNCKYNGGNNLNLEILKLVQEGKAILVCPEQLGGLSTPRKPSEIVGKVSSKVVASDGTDVTEEYQKGAYETLKIANLYQVKKAILKSKSPSCGNTTIYDGTFTHTLTGGEGITTKLLRENGIEVVNEDEYVKELRKE